MTSRLLTAAAGLAGGTVFYLVGLPLPWILGAALAVMIVNAVKPGKAAWPRWAGDMGVMVVAFMLGQRMTMDTISTMLHDLPGMIAAGALWFAVCYGIGLLFARMAGLTEMSAVLGCMPGGLTQMVLLADDMKDADPGAVALMQTSRLVVVLYSVPMLAALFYHTTTGGAAAATAAGAGAAAAGAAAAPTLYGYLALPLVPLFAWLGRRFKVPAGEFLLPMLVSGALSAVGFVWPTVPDPLLAAAQVSIGIYIGLRVQPRLVFENRRFGPLALGAAVLLVALTAVAAWLLSALTGGTVVTWFLSLAPGGLGEVAVTALVLDADVAQVTSYQLFRLLFILLLAPPLLRFALGRRTAALGAQREQ